MTHTAEKKIEEYSKPRIGEFVRFICNNFHLDEVEVLTSITKEFPELLIKERCANCGASMAQYIYTLDVLDALLLYGMGRIVKERMRTMPFHEANKIHIQSKLNDYYSVASRTTQCSKLGLITKVIRPDGTHDQKAGWLITRRGFEFLAGKPVPKKVQTFRNKITERFEETTTYAEVLQDAMNSDPMVMRELNNYAQADYEKLETWAIAGFTQGRLL